MAARVRSKPPAWVCLGLLGAAACGASSAAGEDDTPAHPTAVSMASVAVTPGTCSGRTDLKLSRDVVPVLMTSCSGEFCHGLAMTTAPRAYAFLVGQPSLECDDMRPLVVAGDPGKSYMIDKILGRNMCSGHAMPRGLSNRLSADEIRTVTDWICEGAPRN